MNTVWNLDKIYNGYDDPRFINDVKELDKSIIQLNDLAKNLNQNTAKSNLLEIKKLFEVQATLLEKLFSYASLKQSANTKDVESASYLGRLSDKASSITKPETIISKYIAELDNLDELIDSTKELQEIKYFLNNIKNNNKYILDDKVEEVISKYDISGGNAWADLQSYLTSSVEVDYKGEKTTLSSIRSLANSTDKSIRKEAYDAELACYDKIKDSVAFSLNNIKLQVINECKLRGFDSPLQQTLHNAHMKKETLDALFEAMNEYLPKFHEYLKVKGKALGYNNGLPWYEMFAPMGNNNTKYTTEQTKDYLVNLFKGFAPDLAEMVQTAFDEEWIDFYPRDGKVGGAFCAGIHPIKESRILTNFDGNFSDVVTLAHELGHAYHNYNIKDNNVINTGYSMPVAETASTFNENIIMNAAIASAENDDVKLSLVESQLQDAAQIICDIYSRYLFESKVFENRTDSFMFPDELCKIMIDAQKKAYGDGLDADTLNPYMWVCKGHYYSTGTSYYNFPYAFGGLFARGLYAKYQEEGEVFLPKYKKLLKATTVMSVEDVAKIADIDLTDKAFWEMGLKSYAKQIDLFKELVQK
ncbi:M3 family oligoendopeptidase [Sedimentibacter sp. zth1]|uniref:M3 family oligoendopeptidase n=1 Tax=Sedimentibacter sp. zth1 TaxID=2816908 RepID=UPI001A910E56|nr:M3 family oligoendopeptidase [Sedimentibacter sp. zth1]QSX05772.1 M3 family oligoendopeptidase [Sedimentibacter sp. zth1]